MLQRFTKYSVADFPRMPVRTDLEHGILRLISLRSMIQPPRELRAYAAAKGSSHDPSLDGHATASKDP